MLHRKGVDARDKRGHDGSEFAAPHFATPSTMNWRDFASRSRTVTIFM